MSGITAHRHAAPGAVDAHAHIYPSFYLDALEAAGVSPTLTAIARGRKADSTHSDLDERLEWAERAGVGAQNISVAPQVPSAPSERASADLAKTINDHCLDIAADKPGRFLPYAALPLPHIDAALAEIERTRSAGFLGYSLTTFLPDGASLAGHALDPVWEALDDLGSIVNIHPTGQGLRARALTDFGLHWVNGAPVEDATAVLQLLKAGIPSRFPRIVFHIAHLGGDLAFIARRLEDNFEDWNSFPSSPMASLAAMYFDAANFHEPALRAAVETYGSDRILAGSDHPYFQEEKYVRAFDYIRDSALPRALREAILRGKAESLYGLAPANAGGPGL